MKIKLLEAHGNLKPGAEWNCPWAAKARQLIEQGKALALEAADLHLNPAAEDPATEEPEPEPKPKAKKKSKPKPRATTE